MVYRRQNRLDEAEAMYLRSIELNDQNNVPLQNLAVVYRLQNRLNDAYELYVKMIALNENNPESYYGIGELYYIVGNYSYSIAFFDKALELYIAQNSALVYDVFFYKGVIFYRTGNFDEALRFLEEARKGNPNNATIENLINDIKQAKT